MTLRSRTRSSSWIIWCASMALMVTASYGESIDLFVVNPLEKVFKDTVLVSGQGAEKTLRLEAAANEYESAQFVIRSRQPLHDVSVEVNPLTNADTGVTIPASELRWRFVGYVPVARNTTESRCAKHRDIPPDELLRQAPFDCPDPLLEDARLTIEADQPQPVWITVHVPKGTGPGTYGGEVTIRTPNSTQVLPIELLVYPFELSDERHLDMTNWFQVDHIARAHNVEPLSEQFWQILKNYARNLFEHRQNVIYTSWRLIGVYREADGSLSFDYKDFDRFVQTFIDAGTAERIEITHVAHAGEQGLEGNEILLYKIRPIDRATGEAVDLKGDEGMAVLLRDLRKHLVEQGWLDRTIIHVSDEPRYHNMKEWKAVARFVKENIPGVKTIDAIEATDYEDVLDIMVPTTHDVHTWFDDFKTAQAGGTELWFYTCCQPWGRYANRFTDYHLSKTRILHWMNYFTGTEGFLHWGLTYGWEDPFGPAPRYPPGDSHIIYPGKDGPMSSVRWEMLREGLEDYEYLWLLEARTRELVSKLGVDAGRFPADAFSRELCERLVKSLTNYVTDPETFYQVRRELAREIVQIEESPLILMNTNPPPSKTLELGPATTKVYGFVEKGAKVRINGEETFVDPESGAFLKKVQNIPGRFQRGLSWSLSVVTVEVELGDKKKVMERHFTVR